MFLFGVVICFEINQLKNNDTDESRLVKSNWSFDTEMRNESLICFTFLNLLHGIYTLYSS